VWTVAVPASYVYSVHINSQLWYTSAVHKPGDGLSAIDFSGNTTENRRDLFDPDIFRDVSGGVHEVASPLLAGGCTP
jgi:hypothetical protein